MCVCVCVCGSPVPSYRVSEFWNSDAVGDGVAVASVVHQHAREEHGAEVVAVKDVHCQGGGGRPPVGWVRSAVLQEKSQDSFFFFPPESRLQRVGRAAEWRARALHS